MGYFSIYPLARQGLRFLMGHYVFDVLVKLQPRRQQAIYLSFHRFISNQQNDQLPVVCELSWKSDSSVSRRFKFRTCVYFLLFSFFRPYFHHCLSSVHYYEDRFHIHFFIRSSHVFKVKYKLPHIHITVETNLKSCLRSRNFTLSLP